MAAFNTWIASLASAAIADADLLYNSSVGVSKKMTALEYYTFIKGKTDALYSVLAHTHAANTLTGTILSASVVTSSLTAVGTITTGVWNGTTLALGFGGTGQTTANAAFNALAPSQATNANKFLQTDGTNTSWVASAATDATKLPLAGGTMTGTITSTLGSITTADKPFLTGTVTWNDAAVTFNGIKFDLTFTAGAATSRYFDFQDGGLTLFSLGKISTTWQILIGTGTTYLSQGYSSKLLVSGTYAGITLANTSGTASKVTFGIDSNVLAIMQDTSGSAYGYRFKFDLANGALLIGNDATNGANPTASTKAILDLQSTTRGLLLPRMTTTERDNITSPPAGLMIYNTTLAKVNVRVAAAWETVTSA